MFVDFYQCRRNGKEGRRCRWSQVDSSSFLAGKKSIKEEQERRAPNQIQPLPLLTCIRKMLGIYTGSHVGRSSSFCGLQYSQFCFPNSDVVYSIQQICVAYVATDRLLFCSLSCPPTNCFVRCVPHATYNFQP